MLLYVDDILTTCNNKEHINEIKGWLSSNFEVKDIGKTTYIIRVKISRYHSKELLSLSQESYINKILEWFQMQHCKSINTLIAKGKGLSRRMCPKTL